LIGVFVISKIKNDKYLNLINLIMELFMKDNDINKKDKEEENKFGLMGLIMRVNGLMMKLMVMD